MAINDNLPESIRRRLPAQKAAQQAADAAAAPVVPLTALRKKRDDLAQQFGEMQYDLGGMVYEMAIRDHYRLDVVTKRAAELQRVDAELAEAERLLRLEDAAASGACRYCGSLHARGATFCWQCGERLLDTGTPESSDQNAINGGLAGS
ncbi:MAG: hypothetical protein NT122_02475 [Solirubrobacterales bacterium]|nr:hypothetical protein [Solirubrobacterales bacterium]